MPSIGDEAVAQDHRNEALCYGHLLDHNQMHCEKIQSLFSRLSEGDRFHSSKSERANMLMMMP